MKYKSSAATLSLIIALIILSSCNSKNDITATVSATNESTVSDNANPTTSSADDETDENGASRLAKIVLGSVEFPQMIEVTNESIISDTIGLTLDAMDEYCIMQQMMSVDLAEIIIIKPSEEKTDEILSELEARKEALIDTYAYYPNQVSSAEETVVGSKDGYVYLICHQDAGEAEDALLNS